MGIDSQLPNSHLVQLVLTTKREHAIAGPEVIMIYCMILAEQSFGFSGRGFTISSAHSPLSIESRTAVQHSPIVEDCIA